MFSRLRRRKKDKEMRIGLALGGGGARGLTHIHVLAAMEELGIKPHAIAGTSIGAIIGACFAAGMDSKAIADHILKVFASSGEVFSRLWSARPSSLKDFFSQGFRLSQFDLEAALPEFLPKELPGNIEDLKLPFCAIAAHLNKGGMVAMRNGHLVSALAASASIPGLFCPVKRDEDLLIDGGICNPVPFDCLENAKDFIIAVDVLGSVNRPFKKGRPSLRESLLLSYLISQRTIISTKLSLYGPDVLLAPPVKGIYVLDFLKCKEILEKTKSFKEKAKVLIMQSLEGKSKK